MENNYCVYIHTNKINNKKYIGLTSQNPEYRWKNGKGYKRSTHFYNAIQKYGWDNFDHEIVESNLSKKQAELLESELIKQYNTQNEEFGYNLTSGGEAPKHSEETKEKLRNIFTGRIFSQETINNMKTAAKKRGGHIMTEETKDKIRKTHTGMSLTEETKEKLRKQFSIPVLCVELNKVFPSSTVAAEYFNISKCTISAVLKGRNKTAAGYHWAIYENKN